MTNLGPVNFKERESGPTTYVHVKSRAYVLERGHVLLFQGLFTSKMVFVCSRGSTYLKRAYEYMLERGPMFFKSSACLLQRRRTYTFKRAYVLQRRHTQVANLGPVYFKEGLSMLIE